MLSVCGLGSLARSAKLGRELRDLGDVLKRRRVQMNCSPMNNLSTERRQLGGCSSAIKERPLDSHSSLRIDTSA